MSSARDPLVATTAAVLLVLLFHANGEHLPIADVWPHTYLAVSWLQDGDSTFTPDERPEFFRWRLEHAGRSEPVEVQAFDDELRTLWRAGRLRVERESYLVRRSRWEGHYASTFAPGTALTALPLFAVARGVWGAGAVDPAMVERLGKLVASLCVAGSAAFVFLAARRLRATTGCALGVMFLYALATGVLPISSQNLWQHASCELYLAAAVWAWLGASQRRSHAVQSAVAISLAVCCRPTIAVLAASMALHLARRNVRSAFYFVAAATPFALALFGYHAYLFGHPLGFGELRVTDLAQAKTGRPDIWPLDIPTGLAGLLISPSRGLLVYSPFLLFALVGMRISCRQTKLAPMRPLGVGVVVIAMVHAAYFDWWGGWSYGCRQLVDVAAVAVLFLVPAWPWILSSGWRRILFLAAAVVSVAIQMLGWLAYDNAGWNSRLAWGVAAVIPGGTHDARGMPADVGPARCTFDHGEAISWRSRFPRLVDSRLRAHAQNIDRPEFRYRLWSLRDSQIGYYLRHFRTARAEKQRMVATVCRDRAARLHHTRLSVAQAQTRLGNWAEAEARLTELWIAGPPDVEVLWSLFACQQRRGRVDPSLAKEFAHWRSGKRTGAELERCGTITSLHEAADRVEATYRRAFELSWLPTQVALPRGPDWDEPPESAIRFERRQLADRRRQEVQHATARGDLSRAMANFGDDFRPPTENDGDDRPIDVLPQGDQVFAARLLAALGEWQQAGATFERLVGQGVPLTAEDYDTWGVSLARQQRYGEAQQQFLRALEIDVHLVASALHRRACEQRASRDAARSLREPFTILPAREERPLGTAHLD